MDIFELAMRVTDKDFDQLLLCGSIPLDDIDRVDEKDHSPLYYSIVAGHLKTTKMLMKRHVTLHTEKYTPFMLACFFGQLEMAQFLSLDNSIKDRDVYQNTPLINAAWNGHIALVTWLLSQGAEVNDTNLHGDSALSIALRFGHVETANLLLRQDNIVFDNSNVLSYQPIDIAIIHGYLPIADQLYNKRVDLNKHYTENNTLLHMCAINGQTESLLWLLERGADPHLRNSMGITPLVMAAKFGHANIVSILIERSTPNKEFKEQLSLVLIAAAKNGHGDIIDLVLAHQKKWPTTMFQILLLSAAMYGHLAIMNKILELNPGKKLKRMNKHYDYGDYQYNQGNTLLHAAADRGHLDIVQNLLEQGAKLDVKNNNDDSIVHYAVRSGNLELVRWLCKQHLDVNHKNKQGNTALHMAVELNNEAMVRTLLMHGADSLIENKQKQTPEYLTKHQEALDACFQEFKIRDFSHFGFSKLHHAAAYAEDKAILQLLPVHHDLTLLSEDGLTPVQVAAHLGNVNPLVIMLLWQAKGDKGDAQIKAQELAGQFHSKSRAHATLLRAQHDIAVFPENRLQALLDSMRQLLRGREVKSVRFFLPLMELSDSDAGEMPIHPEPEALQAAAGVGMRLGGSRANGR